MNKTTNLMLLSLLTMKFSDYIYLLQPILPKYVPGIWTLYVCH